MKAMIFYREASDHGRPVREFLRDFNRQSSKKLEEVNPDTPQGANLREIYDVVELPSIVATDNNGQMLQMWRGLPLPRISEVNGYVD